VNLYIRVGSRTLKVFEHEGKVIKVNVIPNLPGNTTFAVPGWDLVTEQQSSYAHDCEREFWTPKDEAEYLELEMDRNCHCGSGQPWHSCSTKDPECG
jgi:hypothetical protein